MKTLERDTRGEELAKPVDGLLLDRAMGAAEKLIKSNDYEIIERGFECSAGTMAFIAQDCNDLLFIDVEVRDDAEDGFDGSVDEQAVSRYEKVALGYLARNSERWGDTPIRFDKLVLVCVGENRAMVKWYRNIPGRA